MVEEITNNVLTKITVLFTLVLALSLVVERFLEILKAVLDLVDDRFNRKEFWTRGAMKMRDRLESKMGVFEYVDPRKAAGVLRRFQNMILGIKDGYTGTVPVISGDLLRASVIKIVCKIAGIGLGIGLAFWMGIDLVEIWHKTGDMPLSKYIPSKTICIILSGIAIGLGTGLVHKVISAIEKGRKKKEGQNHG
ncbi:MAG: hypothetical protein GTO45_39385 [Candidatus Aminicenantes bacterium]|nr:hypothetical protein [Candidatus Aminicenantes bacterium]NIM84692.1 hypothetical protein [Candidatus Aminicenantes bacterium]NIN24191.1 hypothetical protein [Candidatus Aminicenantes bacterium]NIN47916.1 hypothetical protein [Candidatus Aminicenantes bacterium]NIN90854.1 hypothetical protein [Candidatus Aminicenantes bacterium]